MPSAIFSGVWRGPRPRTRLALSILSCVLGSCVLAAPAVADDGYDRAALEVAAESLGQPSHLVLEERLVVDLDYDEGDDVLEGSIELTNTIWVRSESALELASNVHFVEQPSHRMDDVEIRVHSPDGSEERYDEGDLDWLSRIPHSRKVYYVDGEEKFAWIPDVEVGDVVTQEMRFEIRQRHGYPCPKLGGERVLRSELRVELDDDLRLLHRLQGTEQALARLRHQSDDDRETWIFEPAPEDEGDDRRLTIVLHGEHPEGGLAAAPDWQRAGDAYLDLAEERWAAGEPLRERVERALGGVGSDPVERIDALYREVQASCRYLGLFSGRGGIVPDPADEVLEEGHSDCKGLGGLLIAMLREAGIEAHPILLLTAGQGRVEPELPNMAQFNHFIVWADDGSEEGMWLDGTTDERPAGMLPWMDCVEEALLVRRGASRIVAMPDAMWDAGRRSINVEGELDHIHRLDLVIDEECRGEPALSRIWMMQRLPASERASRFQGIFQPPEHRMRVETEPLESTEGSTFRLRGRARSVASLASARGRVFLPAELVPLWVPQDDTMRESVERGLLPFPDVDEGWSLRLPEGLGLSAPDSLEVGAGILRWTMRSWEEDGVLRLRRRLRWDRSSLESFDEDEWEDTRRSIQEALGRHILLVETES